MRIGLVAPLGLGCDANPGWHMITAGIRHLARLAVPSADFLLIDMLADNPVHWSAAATCDAIILCGNPRFSLSDESWWECGIWLRLLQLQIAGIRIIDGWAGACLPLDPECGVDQMAARLHALPRAAQYLEVARVLHARITRDAVMQALYARAGAESTLLPCSSWWAGHQVPSGERDVDAIVLLALPNHDGLPELIREQQARLGPHCLLVASTWGDYLWARGVGLDAVLLHDPESLLRLYARCRRVLAFRIHAAIPAASLGCEVAVVAIDSRALACDLFGLPCTPLDRLTPDLPFAVAIAPDEAHVVATLKEMLCP